MSRRIYIKKDEGQFWRNLFVYYMVRGLPYHGILDDREKLLFQHVLIDCKPRKELAEMTGISLNKLNNEFERLVMRLPRRIGWMKRGDDHAKESDALVRAIIKRDHETIKKTPLVEFGRRCDWLLTPRTLNSLRSGNIDTVADLLAKTEKELMSLRVFGKVSLKEVKTLLSGLGLSLKD